MTEWPDSMVEWLMKISEDDCVLILAYYANEIKKDASMNFSP